jgi:hypothetical protein
MKEDKIIRIKKIGLRKVYDVIGVEKNNNYIANNFIVHNSSENWNLKSNKELKRKLAQIRTKHFFFILCFPLKIKKVDKAYLDSFTNYWLDIFSRGRAALYVRSLSPSIESWRIDDFKDLGNYNEFTSAEAIAKKLSKHPNFWYLVTAPKPSEQLYRRYLMVREKNIYNQVGSLINISKQDICRALLIKIFRDIMMRDSSVTFKRILISMETEYGVSNIKEKDIKQVLEDADYLLEKIKEEGKKEYEDETDNEKKVVKKIEEDDGQSTGVE